MDDQRIDCASGGGVMQIPRFGLKKLLIVVGVVALWLATFQLPEPPKQNPASVEYGARIVGIHLRWGMMFMVLTAAGFTAIYFRGKRQAFWAGFFVAMFSLHVKFMSPDFSMVARSWTAGLLLALHKSTDPVNMLTGSVWAVLQLSYSAVAGLIASVIYDQSKSRK
jgi:hypothetical protein